MRKKHSQSVNNYGRILPSAGFRQEESGRASPRNADRYTKRPAGAIRFLPVRVFLFDFDLLWYVYRI